MLEGLFGSMGSGAWPAPTQIVDTAVNGSELTLLRLVAAELSANATPTAALSTAVFAGVATLLVGALALG